ncbi:hypothetical protein F7U82_23505 [Vibrio parahaemolyticus]|nr:hypothetical protein [Vibrio parahaemolyticus]
MKFNLISYAVKCYLVLYEITGKRPPKGCLADIGLLYEKQLPVLESVNVILNPVNNSQAICARSSSIKLSNVGIEGFGTAIDMDSSTSVEMDLVSIARCNTGVNVNSNKNEEKIMPLVMKNSNFKDVGTVARAPEKMLVEVDNCDFEKIGVGFDFYVPESDLQKIGLPVDTPQELLLEVAKLIRQNASTDDKTMVDIIVESKFGKWLGLVSGAVTIGTPVIANLLTYFS